MPDPTVLLQAVSDEAKTFYVYHGFAESPIDPMVMTISIGDLEKAANAKQGTSG